jgi:DICT domain-containing protein/predicted DNA-binding transcriptional regulator AlpA
LSEGLTIREVAARTGVGQPTLRMWESRYGFPEPRRLPSGHRRYSEADCELIRQVVRERDAGLSLPAAVERARAGERLADREEDSIFAGLRRRRPDLQPYLLPKRTLLALSHAIEDECCARAELPVVFGSFQRERFYRASERRWRELWRGAELAVVFADFERKRNPRGAPAELPVDRSQPLGREWAIVCDAPRYAACMAARERPEQDELPDMERRFETIWSVEPAIVRSAARIGCELAARRDGKLGDRASAALGDDPPPSAGEPRLVGALTSRMVAYVGGAEVKEVPAPHSSEAA